MKSDVVARAFALNLLRRRASTACKPQLACQQGLSLFDWHQLPLLPFLLVLSAKLVLANRLTCLRYLHPSFTRSFVHSLLLFLSHSLCRCSVAHTHSKLTHRTAGLEWEPQPACARRDPGCSGFSSEEGETKSSSTSSVPLP